jgi:hypothetical protein
VAPAPVAPLASPAPVRDRLDDFYGRSQSTGSSTLVRSYGFDDSSYTTVRPSTIIWRNHAVVYNGGWYPWPRGGNTCVTPPRPPRHDTFTPVIKVRF